MSADITLAGVALGLVGGIGGTVLTEALRLRRKPKLSLEPVEGLAPTRIAGHQAAFARLNVHNANHREGATGVSVRIQRIHSDSELDVEKRDFLKGWQLAWSHADRGNPNVPPESKQIPAGESVGVDLIHLNARASTQAIIDIRPQPEPGNHMNRLGAGTFTFELVVSGDNANAQRFTVNIVHDGEPWDGQHATAGDRLRIEELYRL